MGALDELTGAENAQGDDPGQDDQQGGPGPQEPAQKPVSGSTQGEQTWLIQASGPGAGHGQMWIDVGHVQVPPRTKRRTIVEKVLVAFPEAAPAKDAGGETLFRVLDVDSAAGIPVGWEIPPAPEPVLRIG